MSRTVAEFVPPEAAPSDHGPEAVPVRTPAQKRRRRREALSAYAFLSPWLVGLVVVVLGPMIASLYLSFTRYDLIGTPEFNSASMSGAFHCQSRQRSVAIAACTRSIISSHRPVNAATRKTSIASAFPSHQKIPLPLSRWLITRRIALSTAPLPSGRPRHFNQSYRMCGSCFSRKAISTQTAASSG